MSRPALVVAATSLLLVACGGDPATVDATSVERGIRDDVVRQGGSLIAITCPADVPATAGERFDCPITLADGGRAVAHVTMTAADRFDFSTEKLSAG
jgi:Domain of unknown function (DUF4333)